MKSRYYTTVFLLLLAASMSPCDGFTPPLVLSGGSRCCRRTHIDIAPSSWRPASSSSSWTKSNDDISSSPSNSLSLLLMTPPSSSSSAATIDTAPTAEAVTSSTAKEKTKTVFSFIETELRGAAMRLHTTKQAPKEGKVEAPKEEPYSPTHADYLQFLVDSQYVYKALEEIVNQRDEMTVFRSTGLERLEPLERDIEWMCHEFGLERPQVGECGTWYATHLYSIRSIPELVCHYYNFYFAHTSGGLMIGKKMAALLLNKRTLDFYKWEGNLNEIKATVKGQIEGMAATWSPKERRECVDATAMAFEGGGGINSYLHGGKGRK